MNAIVERPESIALFYTEGSSDKEYRAELRQVEGGLWMTLGFNGRRGGTLKEQKKTPVPVEYAVAKKAYDAVVREKTKSGYTADSSGSIYQSLPGERTFSGFVPQLLNVIRDPADLEALLTDRRWWAQEKHDGERRPVQLRRTDSALIEATGINKEGLHTGLPMNLVEAFTRLPCQAALLDGEVMGERYVAFDLLECDGEDLRTQPYATRLARLEQLLARAEGGLEVVRTAQTEPAKRALVQALKIHGAEGLAFKRQDAAYAPGRPASGGHQIKYKFTETCSVRVAAQHATKRSVAVEGLADDGSPVALGSVTIPANATIPSVGAIVNVGYLYWYAKGSLFQPTYQGERTDQTLPDPVSSLKAKAQVAYRQDAEETLTDTPDTPVEAEVATPKRRKVKM